MLRINYTMIYLDNAATSFYKPESVKEAVKFALDNYTANAGRGAYEVAKSTGLKVLEVREKCKELFGEDFECIFTSGCSASLNLAIRGSVKPNSHIITTYLEHNSVLRVLEELRKKKLIHYTVLTDFSKENIERNIRPNTTHVITTHCSNVTGEVIDIKLFSEIAKKHKLIYILDTAQSAGHIDADFSVVDMVAFAGHKGLKGISGVGGLMVKPHIKLKPISYGGTGTSSIELNQPTNIPEGFEVGTIPVIPIISLGEGIKYFLDNKTEILNKEKELGDYLKTKLDELDFVKKYYNNKNVNGVFSFNIGDVPSSIVADMLNEEYEICVRSGLHCAPLAHMFNDTVEQGMVRVSISHDNTFEDIDNLIIALKEINSKLISLPK